MDIVFIISGIMVVVVIVVFAVRAATADPAVEARKRLERAVRAIPNGPAFRMAMEQYSTPVKPSRAPLADDVYVVRRVGASIKAPTVACEYCGSDVPMDEKACRGCGAPRA